MGRRDGQARPESSGRRRNPESPRLAPYAWHGPDTERARPKPGSLAADATAARGNRLKPCGHVINKLLVEFIADRRPATFQQTKLNQTILNCGSAPCRRSAPRSRMRRACRSSAVRCRSTALRVGGRGCRAAACAWIRFAVFDDRLRCGCPRIDRLKVPVDSPTVLALTRRRGAFWLDTTGTQLGRADLPGADQQEAGPRSTRRFFSLAELNTAVRARLD